MLRKKLTSLVLALSMTTATALSLSTYAGFPHGNGPAWGSNFIPEEFIDCIKLEDYDFLIPNYPGQRNVAMYMWYRGPFDTATIFNVYWYPDEIDITALDESLANEIIEKAKSVGGNLTLWYQRTSLENDISTTRLAFHAKNSDGDLERIDAETASAFFELIKDDVEEYNFSSDRYLYQMGSIDFGLTVYSMDQIQRKGVDIQDIQDYLDSEKIEAEIIVDEKFVDVKYLNIIPNNDISGEEHYDLMQKLRKKFGIGPGGGWLESPGKSLKIGGTVDMKNAVKGDANDDSEISIADATAILQALGNPDKYALSAQGEYNADVYGNGDGITPMDAIAIQQYDAKLVSKLPVE